MGLLLLAGVLGGCMTVKLAQRDGCWVRTTHKTLHGTQEEVGPCVRPLPTWSEDRLTRLVQECVAQADYRWQGRALAAWNRHEALPPQDSQETVIKTCMNEAATGVVSRNETLQQRLAEVSSDREALKADATKGEDHLRASADVLTEYLGEAAKRPPPVATATATSTSDGTATTDAGLQSDTAASGMLPAGGASADPARSPPAEARGASPAARHTAKKAHGANARARRNAPAPALPRAGCDGPAAAREGAAGATGADGSACATPAGTGPQAGGSR